MLVAIIRFLESWRRYNTSLRELSQLGDRELADIGISRSEIRGAVSGASGFLPRALGASSATASLNDDAMSRVA